MIVIQPGPWLTNGQARSIPLKFAQREKFLHGGRAMLTTSQVEHLHVLK